MAHVYISAAHKSSGKTTVSLGLAAALCRQGHVVQPYKKGPDYIDPVWLKTAAGRDCYNLDFNTQTHDEIRHCFSSHLDSNSVGLIEGNKGLYDGMDLEGADCNAALAKLLNAPVILVLDCQGITRNAAPLLLGLQQFDTNVNIAGVILNKVAGPRHESKIRSVVEHYTSIPVLGAVRRHEDLHIDERHLGLIPGNEASEAQKIIDKIADRIADEVALDAVMKIANNATPVTASTGDNRSPGRMETSFRLGIAKDSAFGFYYPDDLQAFRENGAEIIYFDTLNDPALPDIDALFIGGGFPETQLQALHNNKSMRHAISEAIRSGMPAYAECGGLMYLSRSISWQDKMLDMVGVIPGDTKMHKRPVGRGYTYFSPSEHHPWNMLEFSDRQQIHAHEFHYSSLENLPADTVFAYQMTRGTGIQDQHDGICCNNLLATYVHQRQTAQNRWVDNFCNFIRTSMAQAGNQ